MTKPSSIAIVALSMILISGTALAAGLSSKVVAIDQQHQQLKLDWDNGTTKSVTWTAKTRFSVLETGARAKPQDVHVGSFLRIQGDEKNGGFAATEIVIWLAESTPAPK